jgi:hypothetical protein
MFVFLGGRYQISGSTPIKASFGLTFNSTFLPNEDGKCPFEINDLNLADVPDVQHIDEYTGTGEFSAPKYDPCGNHYTGVKRLNYVIAESDTNYLYFTEDSVYILASESEKTSLENKPRIYYKDAQQIGIITWLTEKKSITFSCNANKPETVPGINFTNYQFQYEDWMYYITYDDDDDDRKSFSTKKSIKCSDEKIKLTLVIDEPFVGTKFSSDLVVHSFEEEIDAEVEGDNSISLKKVNGLPIPDDAIPSPTPSPTPKSGLSTTIIIVIVVVVAVVLIIGIVVLVLLCKRRSKILPITSS